VREQFDEDLFKALNPPFPPVEVKRFDGCHTGDEVSLELNFILFRQQWTSLITEHGYSESGFYFIDEGKKLPFFLKKWKHRHGIVALTDGTEIIDDISYTSGTLLSDIFLYPLLYLQFAMRKPVYQKYFR
jgi:ligand-binding SRPBCC domain-containing protein